jgi:hypothetical protein
MAHHISSQKHGLEIIASRRLLSFNVLSRDEYLAPIPEAERHDLILAYHAQLNSADEETRLIAAKAWAKWEQVFLSRSLLFI